MLLLEIQEIELDLSLMKKRYNLTKRTTKTEKLEKYFKMFIKILRLFAINWLLRVTSIIQSSIKSLWDLSSICGYLKNKNSKFKKRMSEKKVEGIKKMNFSLKTLLFPIIFKSYGIFLFCQYNFKKSTIMNKYIRTTKLSRKHVLSTPLNSLAFNESQ